VTLGAVYFAQGEADKAAGLFDKALAARPDTAAPMLGLAKVHASKGDVQKALALFDKVVAAHPGTPEAEQAAVFIKELRRQEELAEEVTLC
jgi:TolA-binding protein